MSIALRWRLLHRSWLGTTDIDRRRIKGALDVRRIEFLDHLDAGAAVLGDLVDVGTLYQPHTDVGVAQAVSRARLLVAITLPNPAVAPSVDMNLAVQNLLRFHGPPPKRRR